MNKPACISNGYEPHPQEARQLVKASKVHMHALAIGRYRFLFACTASREIAMAEAAELTAQVVLGCLGMSQTTPQMDTTVHYTMI